MKDNLKEASVGDLYVGQSVLILDTDNYKSSYSCSKYPYEGVVSRLTDYPTIWVKAEDKEFELYEHQIAVINHE